MIKVLYPGSFDPVTLGHLDLVQRAMRLFDRVTVAVAANPTKSPLFSVEERIEMLKEVLPTEKRLTITSFQGLAVDYCKKTGHDAILRGVRTVSDFEFEYQMALTNRHLSDDVETVFVMPNARFAFISSSLMRDVVRHGGDVSAFLPPSVERRLKERLQPRKD